MPFERSFIPYGCYWSTPFCRWQGSFATLHALELAARVGRRFLEQRKIATDAFDGVVLGHTVAQKQSFYGAPWVAGLMGLDGLSGPTVSQACATSARAIVTAALEVEAGQRRAVLCVTCDRTSNGAHIYYPNPNGPGGMGDSESPVWDNFQKDPYAGRAMLETAENVAREAGISRADQEAVTLLRYEQYASAMADDRAFLRRFLVPVELMRGKKVVGTVDIDEGLHPTTADGLAKLAPVREGGTVTFGTQTHPADGNAGLAVTTRDEAKELSRDRAVTVQLMSYAEARVEKAFMPKAVVPAARKALANAGVEVSQCGAIKTHNPFAVNDVYFSREMRVSPERVNRYGSSLVWGHPQGPTGMRAVIELIEELAMAGGGLGLFSGCAAGDTAAALVLRVS